MYKWKSEACLVIQKVCQFVGRRLADKDLVWSGQSLLIDHYSSLSYVPNWVYSRCMLYGKWLLLHKPKELLPAACCSRILFGAQAVLPN